MTTVFFRLLIIYFFTLMSVKFTGKRQVREMQMSELITALFLSELAVYPINDIDIPLSHGVIPVLALISIEVLISLGTVKVPFLRAIFDSKPGYLIKKGKLDIAELKKNRITIDELISELRLAGYPDMSEVYYAILEPSGKLSVIPNSQSRPITPQDHSMSPPEKGIVHTVISDGKINEKVLLGIGRDSRWLDKKLKENKIAKAGDVFLFTVNDNYDCFAVMKKK